MAGPPSDDNIQGKTKIWNLGPDRTQLKNFETWDQIRTEKIDKTLDRTGTEKNSQMSDRTRPGAPWIPEWA